MTLKAFENAITVVTALGGSTNAVLHLLAMAHAAGVSLSIDDFTRIGKNVPVLADLKPSGRFVMAELVAIGGILPLMKTLLDAGLLHGDCLTVTGKTVQKILKVSDHILKAKRSSVPLNNPIKKEGHSGHLVRETSPPAARLAKITGKEGSKFSGKARVFDSEEAALKRILDGTVKAGDVIVIRYEGPQRRPRACARCFHRPPPLWAKV